MSIFRRLTQLAHCERGISGVEYAALLALIGAALAASMLAFGNQVAARLLAAAAALVAP